MGEGRGRASCATQDATIRTRGVSVFVSVWVPVCESNVGVGVGIAVEGEVRRVREGEDGRGEDGMGRVQGTSRGCICLGCVRGRWRLSRPLPWPRGGEKERSWHG